MALSPHGCTYLIDRRDVVRSVSSSWVLFARSNDAQHLDRNNVVGRSLWEFVAGERVRAIYLKLLQRVRRHGESLIVPFRCDSPNCRRDMQLSLRPRAHGEVLFASQMIRSLPRETLTMPFISLGQASDSRPMCSFCLRILQVGQGWLELDEIAGHVAASGAKLEHGVCPKCEQLAKVFLIDHRVGSGPIAYRPPGHISAG